MCILEYQVILKSSHSSCYCVLHLVSFPDAHIGKFWTKTHYIAVSRQVQMSEGDPLWAAHSYLGRLTDTPAAGSTEQEEVLSQRDRHSAGEGQLWKFTLMPAGQSKQMWWDWAEGRGQRAEAGTGRHQVSRGSTEIYRGRRSSP